MKLLEVSLPMLLTFPMLCFLFNSSNALASMSIAFANSSSFLELLDEDVSAILLADYFQTNQHFLLKR